MPFPFQKWFSTISHSEFRRLMIIRPPTDIRHVRHIRLICPLLLASTNIADLGIAKNGHAMRGSLLCLKLSYYSVLCKLVGRTRTYRPPLNPTIQPSTIKLVRHFRSLHPVPPAIVRSSLYPPWPLCLLSCSCRFPFLRCDLS